VERRQAQHLAERQHHKQRRQAQLAALRTSEKVHAVERRSAGRVAALRGTAKRRGEPSAPPPSARAANSVAPHSACSVAPTHNIRRASKLRRKAPASAGNTRSPGRAAPRAGSCADARQAAGSKKAAAVSLLMRAAASAAGMEPAAPNGGKLTRSGATPRPLPTSAPRGANRSPIAPREAPREPATSTPLRPRVINPISSANDWPFPRPARKRASRASPSALAQSIARQAAAMRLRAPCCAADTITAAGCGRGRSRPAK